MRVDQLSRFRSNKEHSKTIEDLMKTYPQSEAAQAGKERLASIK